MSPEPTYHDWPTKAEAAQALGVTSKSIERMVKNGQLQVAYRRTPGRRPLAVYDPIEVSRLAGEKRGAQPSVEHAVNQAAVALGIQKPFPTGERMLQLLSLLPPGAPKTAVPLKEKLYLTLDEAVEYSGLPASYLYRKMREGLLDCVRADRWVRIRRKSLDLL